MISNFCFLSKGEFKEDPSVLLWTYFFIAQHHDQLRKTDLALRYIDKVLQHTPTLIEGYMVKAKIYKVCQQRFEILYTDNWPLLLFRSS